MSFGPYYINGKDVTSSEIFSGIGGSQIPNTNPEFRLSPKTPLIDVVGDFAWTSSPVQNSKPTIPYLFATELRQEQNSLIASALYYINAISNSSITEGAATIIDKLLSNVGTTVGVGGTNVSAELLTGLKGKIDSFISTGVDKSIISNYLTSYLSIYLTQPTGFKYSFPFFEGKPHSIANDWQSSMQIKPKYLSNLVEDGMDFIDTAAATINALQPGTYIEKPKYFHFPSEGESITINLPLLNTIRRKENLVPYQQNYELLWLLAYQNKPYRTSFSRILPPKLYTVTIPGMKFFPYSYISNMSVDFLGTRRQLPVNTPKGEIITSIPEAYQVSITFTSLIADVGNLMVSNGFTSPVTVRTKS